MNNTRNSVVILAKNINMDKEYQNIIDYTESEIVDLCTSQDHLVARQNNYSFLKVGDNRISVGLDYNTCLSANYLCMQNPHYNNKWFFAFIDSVEYSSEKSTIINYTVDEISTWWSYWTRKQCFVVREHVNDDTLGANTMPEGLETGEYKINGYQQDNINTDLTTILATTRDPNDLNNVAMGMYNGITSGVGYYRYDRVLERWHTGEENLTLEYAMKQLAEQSDAIVGLFLAPKWLAGGNTTYIPVTPTTTPITEYMFVSRINNLDGYIPKNNKCLCFPYCYIELSNGAGQANTFNQERWENGDSGMTLVIQGCLTPGGSVRCYPYNYNGVANNYDESISLGKFPQLNWKTDHYTNWLTQNGMSIGALKLNAEQAQIFNGVGQIGLGAASIASAGSGNILGVAEGLGDIKEGTMDLFNSMQERYTHSLVPPTLHGSLNNGDIITASGTNKFHVYKMTVKREFAESIDAFFTRFGYRVNALKTPNFTGRQYFNFVQIAGGEIIGYANGSVNVPESSMEIINATFRRGTTIWHDHNNIGNYSLDNTII